MNKKNIAKVVFVVLVAAWVGKLTYSKSSNRALANAFPAKLLASPGACTTPEWPPEARRYEVEGITLLHFRIGADGQVEHASVAGSSSWQMLDDAAMKSLVKCRFKPNLDEAEQETVFPIQFVWTLSGPSSARPQLIAGSCAHSTQFSGFEPLNRAPTGKDGVLLRFLVNGQGEPFGVKPEAASADAAAAEAASAFIQTCRFAIDPALEGEQTDTLFGRVVVASRAGK